VEVNPQEPLGQGPLNGIPFGVKDIVETKGLATEYGSVLCAGRKGSRDAPLVTQLRQVGGVLFGKTQTTAFAYLDAAPTRNPRNPAHTPGGSSSGSAAAVAAGVVPFAIGTQTMGSIVRPASFCGVVGFKPTFGTLPTDGVLAFAPSLDTVGLLAENVGMCVEVWRALQLPVSSESPLRFGIPTLLPLVSDEMSAAFEQAIGILRRDYVVESIDLPYRYTDLLAAARCVNDYEGSRSHHDRWKEYGDRIGEKLASLIVRGTAISDSDYQESLQLLQTAIGAMSAVFAEFPILLTPATPGAAPAGLSSTGDPVMNAVWTALGTPAIGIPIPRAAGLPLSLQLIARHGADSMLLNAAKTVEDRFLRGNLA
jgi:Asp-tRNA(Asn)/Glu-tRNA(Gln) amidotransferase A subunit family amidase